MKRPREPLRSRAPRRRCTLFRLVKWAGAAACGIIIAECVASFFWRVIATCSSLMISFDRGGFDLSFGIWGGRARPHAAFYRIHSRERTTEQILDHAATFGGIRPGIYNGNFVAMISAPIWFLLALAAVPTSALWWLDRRRAWPGRCPACGYNLTGNVSGTCPECGNDINAKASE